MNAPIPIRLRLSQGLLQIHEDSVTLHVRHSDESVTEQAAAAASQAYRDISGRSVHFTIKCSLPRDRYAHYLPSVLPFSHKAV
jgi:hypothetical protein